MILKALIGIRVSPQEEIEGLDIAEHGIEGYIANDQLGAPVVLQASPAGD